MLSCSGHVQIHILRVILVGWWWWWWWWWW